MHLGHLELVWGSTQQGDQGKKRPSDADKPSILPSTLLPASYPLPLHIGNHHLQVPLGALEAFVLSPRGACTPLANPATSNSSLFTPIASIYVNLIISL